MIDVLGPTLEFLTSPDEPGAVYCVMRGTIPPGVSVPLHSHADPETFYVISGFVEALRFEGAGFEWRTARPGEIVHIPSGIKHAFRNTSREPVVELIATTPKIAQFFREVGRPISPGERVRPPAAADIRRFLEAAARYGYWNATPEENAAVGISLPPAR